MSGDEIILRVEGLEKVFHRSALARVLGRAGHPAVAGVDLAVGRGSVFGLLGPNGAGKTTLVKILLGLVRGHRGRAELFGRPAGDPRSRRRVGFLPEAHRLPGYLTGFQVMKLFGMLAGKSRSEVLQRAPELLERVGMLQDAKRKVREYSKGMQQRLGLAQALVHDPELVFLDEPTDGVDPVGRAAIREIVTDLARRGVTVFINSHLLMEVEMICDRVVIMSRGKILKEGTIQDLTPYTGVVRFDLAEIPSDLAGLLVGLGQGLRVDGRSFELSVNEPGLNAAIDRLRGRGAIIRSISPRKLTLEESFIDLVRKGGSLNPTIARALLEDAWRQVVDNKVFRLLVIAVMVPIALTFAIGFHADRIDFLWGWKHVDYDELSSFFGQRSGTGTDYRGTSIQAFQSVMVSFFGGIVGVMFCLTATAFFVPRMMEKGAADMLFSKPVSRFVLLLSRYVAGLLFVGTLAVLLVFGMFLGLWITSGYEDTGFLWGAFTLIYLYAILYAFTIAAATSTRSSTAAILLSFLLFVVSGGIHRAWMFKEYDTQDDVTAALAEAAEGETSKTEAEVRRELWSRKSSVARFFLRALDVLHYALPKTTEAAILTEELKQSLERRSLAFSDPDGKLWIQSHPDGFEPSEASAYEGAQPLAAWSSTSAAGPQTGRAVLAKRSRNNDEGRRVALSRVAGDFSDALGERLVRGAAPREEEVQVAGRSVPLVIWEEVREGRALYRERVFFPSGDWIYELDVELEGADWTAERRADWRGDFLRGWAVDEAGTLSPDEMLMSMYGWDAPLRFNLFFSIGTSVAFALAMLALSWRKLRSIDF